MWKNIRRSEFYYLIFEVKMYEGGRRGFEEVWWIILDVLAVLKVKSILRTLKAV
jgi:hypothetical protein